MAQIPRHVRSCTAGSTGRRNTGVKSLCWGVKLQGLTWPFVELTSHFAQIGLRVHRQVGALRKVLSQQAIGVLVRPALPRRRRTRSLVGMGLAKLAAGSLSNGPRCRALPTLTALNTEIAGAMMPSP